jgi:hypothetical protein
MMMVTNQEFYDFGVDGIAGTGDLEKGWISLQE